MERQTRQQLAVTQAIADSGRSLSPLEIWALAQQAVPRINLSTVYRQLKSLHDEGRVLRVQLPGQAPRFEPAPAAHGASAHSPASLVDRQAGGDGHGHAHHHHHFHCLACEQVFPLHACPGGIEKLAPQGYEVQRHDLTLHGRCPSCVAGAA
jgi:Fur family transcriptional regulator, ferric uptake regulator